MAKEYRHAPVICGIITVIAILGIIAGILKTMPIVVAFSIIPAIIYEIYRTEGIFTRIASWLALIVILVTLYVIHKNVMIDIIPFIAKCISMPVTVKLVPAGLIAPVVLVVIAVYLFKRTAGIYTRWLAVVILVGSVALFYTLDPQLLKNLLSTPEVQQNIKEGVREGIRTIQ
ncbi:MAG: hypothetical protein QHH74_00320 [Spirochaetota bacterium]|nr:hypothetical protein [Spirochaetota bacterium]